jgi:Tfp pilus assembly protein PilN
MTQVNLLPSDVRQKLKTRQLTILVGMVGAIVVALLLGYFVLQNNKLASANNDLAAAKAQNNALQSQITSLNRYKVLNDQVTSQKTTVSTAKAGSVEFSGVLHDLSMVIPSNVYVTGVTGTLTLGDGAATQPNSGNVIGNIQFQGSATDHLAVALWLTRLAQVSGWDNSWITASVKRSSNGSTDTKNPFVDFTGTVDIGVKAEKGGK